MRISIVIPTYNEAAHIAPLVRYLLEHGGDAVASITVSDGGSTDETRVIAADAGAQVLQCPQKGRAAQMNHGAALAPGDVLYFVHADTCPPKTFVRDIAKALESGYDLGRYRTRFDSRKWLLRLNAFFTRFDLFICMGGDQTLFIRKALFRELGGFRSDMRIMEEYEFCTRARAKGRYVILKGETLVSARKYDKNSWLQVQRANYAVVRRYKEGASQDELVAEYQRRLTL